MTPSSSGWSEARANGLKTYTGKPCADCGNTLKTTHNKECTNKCYRTRNQKYKSVYKAQRTNISRLPEKIWEQLAPDFEQENLEIRYS